MNHQGAALPADNASKRLLEEAGNLSASGQAARAAECFQALLHHDPAQPEALRFLTGHYLALGRVRRCESMLEQAIEASPGSPHPRLYLALLRRSQGRADAALEALEQAIERGDGGIAALYKGRILYDQKQFDAALKTWSRAWQEHPQYHDWRKDPALPQTTYRLLEQSATAIVDARDRHIERALQQVADEYGRDAIVEMQQAMAVTLRQREPAYTHALQRPTLLHYASLTPEPFYDPGRFDWIPDVEARTSAIREELLRVLHDPDDLKPYVEVPDGKDPAQWRALNQSLDWSSYHLIRDGEQLPEHCQRCPETLEAVAGLPLVDVQGHAPELFYSILKPGTHIPPHYGLANYKLAVHLPLVIPEQCAIRVGDRTHAWSEGQIVVFDDSFEHEAWNRSDKLRAVLIFEIWHPDLSEGERAAIRAGIEALLAFNHEHGLALNLG